MTKEEWANADCAQSMLDNLYREQPAFLATQVPQLHKYFLACCWKHQHLIPQKRLRDGLRGAEDWVAGTIDDEELYRLNRHAESEAFAIDYAEAPDEIGALRSLIGGIPELSDMPFDEARHLLGKAAYFAETSMVYPTMRSLPRINSLFTSQFLCPDLLREFVVPAFDVSP
ncbi:MAG: hypothetical protein KDA53_13060 [Hyphomonas sp.]|nr:hypothetical protein [Hyphomonas sp.]